MDATKLANQIGMAGIEKLRRELPVNLPHRRHPIIVMGMHRSGTSLVAEILRALGVFLGHRLDQHTESIFFTNINDWLLGLAHASWDHPLPFRNLQVDQVIPVVLEEIVCRLRSKRFTKDYLGLSRKQLDSHFAARRLPWGWKDPRNTITYPIWRRLYHRARFVFVHRNGLDVALSLAKREQANVARAKKCLLGRHGSRFTSLRCQHIEQAFTLWEEYNGIFLDREPELSGQSLMKLSYESLLHRRNETVAELAAFVRVSSDSATIDRAASLIDPARAPPNAIRELPSTLYKRMANSVVAQHLGYHL